MLSTLSHVINSRAGLLTILFAALAASPARAQIVVFAPHPDDEALMASGIINRARANGETVKVVVATNGDCEAPAIAQQRQQESIAAMTVLGLAASDVIFLGYPDCGLRPIYFEFVAPGSRYTSKAGRTHTYGFHGLGNSDYHSYVYGAPALYNKPAILQDIRTVLQNYRPQDIYVTSAYDEHPDHSALNFYVVDAVVAHMREHAAFQPTIHDSIVHEPCEGRCNLDRHWPMPSFTPTQPFTAPPLLSMSAHAWADVESVIVPAAMQSTNAAANTKYQAISRYLTQGSPWLLSFVKRDEVFWRSELWSNLAMRATATASSAGRTTPASRISDGSVTGGERKPDGEWVSNGQASGAWAQLTWPSEQQINRVILHDRIDAAQNVLAGALTFSDGSSLDVGALPANGAGLTMQFAPKSVTWARFTITSAAGLAAGLAEMQVFGSAAAKLPAYVAPSNQAPVVTTGPSASPASISDASKCTLTAAATDANGDHLTYSWTPAQGTITGSGGSVTWVPQPVATATTVRVTLVVADGRGGRDTKFVDVSVSPSGQPVNIADVAAVTASSQVDAQPATRAIDGVIDGYPGDASKEWASVNEQAGAWIQLTWNATQTLSRVVLHDRINSTDQVLAGSLRFSDGSALNVGALPNEGAGLTINFAAKTVTWVRLQVTSARGDSVGLAEFKAFSNQPSAANRAPRVDPGPTASPTTIEAPAPAPVAVNPTRATSPNLALLATATASTERADRKQGAAKAVDGAVSGYPVDVTREWATAEQRAGAWIQLTWAKPRAVSRVVLHDRINPEDQILGGILRFSDGTTIAVGNLPNDGAPQQFDFASRNVTWVRLEITDARGWSTGLAEFEVY